MPNLIVGTIYYEERLAIGDFSLNSILIVTSFIFYSLTLKLETNMHKYSLVAFIFLMILPIVTYFSDVDVKGFYKYSNSVIIGVLGFFIIKQSVKDDAVGIVLKTSILFLLVLFVAAIIWKLKSGFWVRSTLYFMNGSIVFGRNMAVGFILSYLFVKNKKLKILLCAFFLFGVFWSMSKGPILAMVMVLFWMIFKQNKKFFCVFSILIFFLFFCLMTNIIDFSGGPLQRIQNGFQVLFGFGDLSRSGGSVGARSEMVNLTIGVIKEYPFTGVGPGNWSNYTNSIFPYPHNILLEVISELGFFYGMIYLVLAFSFVFYPKSITFSLALFYAISQQISGDVADARWLILFSLLSTSCFTWYNDAPKELEKLK